jgi:uncharacterized protein
MEMNAMDKLAYVLAVIGGLNWGLVGLFQYNLVDSLFGVESGLSRVIYTLVGFAALFMLVRMVTMMSAERE